MRRTRKQTRIIGTLESSRGISCINTQAISNIYSSSLRTTSYKSLRDRGWSPMRGGRDYPWWNNLCYAKHWPQDQDLQGSLLLCTVERVFRRREYLGTTRELRTGTRIGRTWKIVIEKFPICQDWANLYYWERFSFRGQANVESLSQYLVEYQMELMLSVYCFACIIK